MSKFNFSYRRATILKVMISLFIFLLIILVVILNNIDFVQSTENGTPYSASIANAPLDNDHIDFDVQPSKLKYKISEPIIIKFSIRNHSSKILVYADRDVPADYEIVVREKELGELSPNELGKRYKQPHGVMLKHHAVKLKMEEEQNFDWSLRNIFDIREGSYEVIVQRRLFILGTKNEIELKAKPIQFDVVK